MESQYVLEPKLINSVKKAAVMGEAPAFRQQAYTPAAHSSATNSMIRLLGTAAALPNRATKGSIKTAGTGGND